MRSRDILFQQLDAYTSSPILFIGSGMSLRYLGAETWEGLLYKFSERIGEPFEKYKSRANQDWPKVGSLLAIDYNEYWFKNPDMAQDRDSFKREMVQVSSPLKVMISKYLKNLTIERKNSYDTEIDLLRTAKIDGIITTNYDLFLENVFPDFKVYKSQRELIFSPLQEVGEIYKIHGCCTEPNSIVITSEDYENYNAKNAYLAAKLLATFLEHPIIFLGYSIGDPNIRGILKLMITCLNQTQIDELSRRLFFVEYRKGIESMVMEKFNLDIGGIGLPVTRLLADSYVEIYKTLATLNRRYPASLLRKIKEHIYELVKTNDPSEKITVIDFDSNTELDKVEVVLGVGVASNIKESVKGYEAYTALDVALDVLYDNLQLSVEDICYKTLPKLPNVWLPVCKYISQISDKSEIDSKVLLRANKSINQWKLGLSNSHKAKEINIKYPTIESVLSDLDPQRALTIIPILEINKINISTLEEFLRKNKNFIEHNNTKSHWMRLVCMLDRLKYGNS